MGWCVVVGEWGRGSLVVGVKYSYWLSAYRCKMAWVLRLCVESQVSYWAEVRSAVSAHVLWCGSQVVVWCEVVPWSVGVYMGE